MNFTKFFIKTSSPSLSLEKQEETKEEETKNVNICDDSQKKQEDPFFPKLAHCSEPISLLKIDFDFEKLQEEIKKQHVVTIGDLSRQSVSQIKQLPFEGIVLTV